MTKISNASLERCSAIAAAIDEELRKEKKDRKDLFIRSMKPRQIKRELEAYKTHMRNEWRGQFWMIVHNTHVYHGPCVQISFGDHSRLKNSFEIVRDNEEAIEIFQQDVGVIEKNSFAVTEAQQLNDEAASMFILMESPINMKLDMTYLNTNTMNYLHDPQNHEQTPLLNLIQKRGYTVEVRGKYLWIYRGDE